MKARSLLLVAALGAASLCFAAYRWLAEPAGAPAADAAASTVPERDPESPAPRSVREDAPIASQELALVESARAAGRGRTTGSPPSPPSELVAVRGRVVDASSGEPVQGMTLCLLSRRPRTCTARTDAEGRFATGAELSMGVVAVAHAPDAESPMFSARWTIEPGTFLALGPDAPGGVGEIVLAARAPDRELAIDVRLPEGGAAPAASVSLTWGRREELGAFRPEGRAYEVTDRFGRARFAILGSDAWEWSFRIEAESGGTLASDVLSLDPPIGKGPPVLDLHPGGLVRVRTNNDEGRPVAGVSIWIETQDESGPVRGRAGETDARGECVFTALRPGCYAISAVHPSTGQPIRREVELGQGAQESVDLRLTLAGLRLRLAGCVVDELGYALPGVAVRAAAAGEPWVGLTSGEGGRFEFWGRPCEGAVFAVGGGFRDDRYDPELMSVPCGSTGLTVRRLAKLEDRSWPFEVRDRGTGEPVVSAAVTLFHGDPRGACPAMQSFTANGGIVQVEFKQREDLGYAVDAPGYLREQGPLSDLLADAGRLGLLRVELERGFERRLEVLDRVTRRGIADVVASAAGAVVGRGDEQGRIRLRSDRWPAEVRVEAPGYSPVSWDPAAAGFPGDVVWLEPLRSDR